jgi:multicomponent Na+:H+ antiporter subunit E
MKLIDQEGLPLQLGWRILPYWGWLIYSIIDANIKVAKIILSPRMPISPTVTRLPCSLKSGLAQATYANSITLTPGTVCLKIDDSQVEIHALTHDMANDLRSGEMENRVAACTGRS